MQLRHEAQIAQRLKNLLAENEKLRKIKNAAFKVTQNWCFEAISAEVPGDCVVPKEIMQELHDSFSATPDTRNDELEND